MAEQTFKSPGFFDREVDLSAPVQGGPIGTPAGVIGTANKGPAFVPVTVANFAEFTSVFGDLDTKKMGPYAANEFLKHRSALTYLRVLGAGANATDADVANTQLTGRVLNAGVRIEGSVATNDNRHVGAVQFLAARHLLQSAEAVSFPMFSENSSFSGNFAHIVRGVVLMASSARLMVADYNANVPSLTFSTLSDTGSIGTVNGSSFFKLIVSSSLPTFATSDGLSSVLVMSASFDPSSANYIGRILNTDPGKFVTAQHLLYADYAVDNEIATAQVAGVLSGTNNTSLTSGETTTPYRRVFGAFDTRYKTPKTSNFISQPFGATEYDLFWFEALDDGEYANKLYKISISNVRASQDASDLYGTFNVEVRDWNDDDTSSNILEQFVNCSLDPNAANFVGKLIGDRKVLFNFDSSNVGERRLYSTGRYPNKSKYVRVQLTPGVLNQTIPRQALPFGFRGLELLKTNDSLTDSPSSTTTQVRLGGVGIGVSTTSQLTGAILPPLPFRTKLTRGEVPASAQWLGQPGTTETTFPGFYWGIKFSRNNVDALNVNVNVEKNRLLESLTKFIGIRQLDALVTGSGADTFNLNKFTLSKVALSNANVSDLTASLSAHMREAAYVRNAVLDPTTYKFNDSFLGPRLTFASLLASLSAADFNKWTTYTKFTNMMYGGYDGTNFLDIDAKRMSDKAASFDAGGGAAVGFLSAGQFSGSAGYGSSNSTVISYKTAVDVMTDPLIANINLLAIPGIRESYLTDYAADKVRTYGFAMYVMDVAAYDDMTNRLYEGSTSRPSVERTTAQFESRAVDNSYVATYFPDVVINDNVNNRTVMVPASVAAYGALAFNDQVGYPWFAPAGFNRASLDFVKNVCVRLSQPERDRLQVARINPIATIPRLSFVIFGQKTLQVAHTALDRVNVRRLLLEIKRIVSSIAGTIVFDQNTPVVRQKFTTDASTQLGLIQSQSGIEAFQVIMNETNNTQEDVNLNRLRGRVVIVPTRSIEFITVDFVITNTGIQFT